MPDIQERATKSFKMSRKLEGVDPSADQLDNIEFRLLQIFTPDELDGMSEEKFTRQVERVWPIAKYVDEE